MANEKNLIPFNKRTESERREIAEKGGIESGKSRRRKKDTAELVNLLLGSKLKGDDIERLKTVSDEVEDDDMTVNALMVAGQIKSAMAGNVKAFECLQSYQSRTEKDDDTDAN